MTAKSVLVGPQGLRSRARAPTCLSSPLLLRHWQYEATFQNITELGIFFKILFYKFSFRYMIVKPAGINAAFEWIFDF